MLARLAAYPSSLPSHTTCMHAGCAPQLSAAGVPCTLANSPAGLLAELQAEQACSAVMAAEAVARLQTAATPPSSQAPMMLSALLRCFATHADFAGNGTAAHSGSWKVIQIPLLHSRPVHSCLLRASSLGEAVAMRSAWETSGRDVTASQL